MEYLGGGSALDLVRRFNFFYTACKVLYKSCKVAVFILEKQNSLSQLPHFSDLFSHLLSSP